VSARSAPQQQSPLDAAYRYLSYRPRAEFEMRVWLERKGFAHGAIESTISTLKSKGLVDDMAFARYWRESRDSGSPRSRAALKSELARKGIDAETAAGALDGIDDEAAAYRAAQKRAARLGRSDREEFRSKLSAALRRRGFSYEVTEHTVNRLWQESRCNE
jgi:regulatory protein